MATTTTVLITAFEPFPSFVLSLPSCSTLGSIPSHLPPDFPSFDNAHLVLSTPRGAYPSADTPLSALRGEDVNQRMVTLRVTPRLLGGKGGFGSQLRAAGGRMSSQKTNNNDSCRDLNGRRLSTLKEAKVLAAYLESEPDRIKAQQEEKRAKLEALERKLGIGADGKPGEPSVGAKRRFDDTEYLEQSKDIVDNVKSAVSVALLKKKKKAKNGEQTAATGLTRPSASSNGEKIVEKVVESPATAPMAAAVSIAAAAVGA